MASSMRSGKRRALVLAVLAFIVLAQTALVVHQIQHDAVPHSANCVLCLAATHAASPPPVVVHDLPALMLVERLALPVARSDASRFPSPYLSRGPPLPVRP